MSHSKTILLTGATGLLGSELLSRILFSEPHSQVLVLLRGDAASVQSKFRALLEDAGLCRFAERVEPVSGDLLRPGLGLEPRARDALIQDLTHVIHAAAAIHFDLAYPEAHAINYEGTARVYELAAHAKHLQAFAHISTAYVAGRRTGVIAEQDLDHKAGFVNNYERTKYECERFLRARMQELPIAIYRTTTMIGDSLTGAVRQFNYFHSALRALYLGKVPFIPGDPAYRVDVIPQNWAAEVIRYLALENFQPGKTYHVCAGPAHSFSLCELLESTVAAFASFPGARRPHMPTIVSHTEFQRALAHADTRANGKAPPYRLPHAFDYFIAELLLPKWFDSQHLLQDFASYAGMVPDIRAYYAKVIEFCLQQHWGRGAHLAA